MNFKDLKNKIKEEQKELAQKIIRGKYLRKPSQREDITKEDEKMYFYRFSFDDSKLQYLRDDYRHNHIAYCMMFNGTPYDKIEKPSDDNSPSSDRLESLRKNWEDQLDEDVRNCA